MTNEEKDVVIYYIKKVEEIFLEVFEDEAHAHPRNWSYYIRAEKAVYDAVGLHWEPPINEWGESWSIEKDDWE